MLNQPAAPLPKRCVLTGHSRGLGAGMLQVLLEAGFEVMGISRHTLNPPFSPTAQKLTEKTLDLSDASAVDHWLASGGLHRFLHNSSQALLINNAGRVGPIAPAGLQGSLPIAASIALNVSAPLMLSDAFIAATAHCADRRILHVSSGAGRSAYPGWSVYCASKAALDHHARAVAAEATPGLQICSLAPGIIDTDMQAEIRNTQASLFPMKQKFDELKKQGLLSSPEETASALIHYLLGNSFGRQVCEDLRNR